MDHNKNSAEHKRIQENELRDIPLELWGPYLSERQWGTVREDYSENGDAWNYFPHDHARSRVYLWGEDGLAGISDYFQNMCFALALWNGKDPILKERLFGLNNIEGNHGEDVKELYYYLDNVPTHYYMKYLYKYPQNEYPYLNLIQENARRNRHEPEYEILDTGIFDHDEYFDVVIEYAKKESDDIFIKIEVINKNQSAASITILPTIWFYNRWQYGGMTERPELTLQENNSIKATHERLGTYYLYYERPDEILFTENETNFERLYQKPNTYPFVKDAFHTAIVNGELSDELKKKKAGTKASTIYKRKIDGDKSLTLYLRLTSLETDQPFEPGFESIFESRKGEANQFYNTAVPIDNQELALIRRQALSGMLWNRQYYHLDNDRWLKTSDGITPVNMTRLDGRNHLWPYLKNQDVISMPDKWEYPWYAAWDTAFHAISLSLVDPVFAKNQLILLMREWYMNPEGQLPAYEWNFNDVNPPVHAFAALQVYQIEKDKQGRGDVIFLKRIFQKLIINFTWWANRKDVNGNNIFEGGFLGLDNIGLFNRSMKLPGEVALEQADATSWMGMYALNMMDIALELSCYDDAFEDSAIKFYEHFVIIAEALNELGLWNEEDRFFYDVLCLNGEDPFPLKVRSVVGLAPLFAVSIIKNEQLDSFQEFNKRMQWLKDYRNSNGLYLPSEQKSDARDILLSLVHKDRMVSLLEKLLDEDEFLSPQGIRSVSAFYKEHPYSMKIENLNQTIQYDPGDATSGLFGGNSNWRGPVWMPINFLLIRALQKYGKFYGDSLKVEFPTRSGNYCNLNKVAHEISMRLINIFTTDGEGNRKVFGNYNWFYKKEMNKDLILFHEYFHGDTGMGLGASHQTGWTALIANLLLTNIEE